MFNLMLSAASGTLATAESGPMALVLKFRRNSLFEAAMTSLPTKGIGVGNQ
jgi:hypothetical protein